MDIDDQAWIKPALESLIRVQQANMEGVPTSNPNGQFPVCMPKLRTNVCERCEREINQQTQMAPCPAVAPEDRWGPDWKGNS